MKIKLLDFGAKENGYLPKRAHYNDSGADVYSPKDYTLVPGEWQKIPLGFGLELPDGYAGYIYTRSSMSAKNIDCLLPPVDSGYRGEIHAIVSNQSNRPFEIKKGDRIGQLVIMPCLIADFVTETGEERGARGYGSTGA